MTTNPQSFPQNLSSPTGLMFHFPHYSQRKNQNQLAFPDLNLNDPFDKFPLLDHKNQTSSCNNSQITGIQDRQIPIPSYLSPLEEDFHQLNQQHDYDDMIKDFLLSGIAENSKTVLKKTSSFESNQSSSSISKKSQISKRRTWKPEEDALVMQLIEKHGQKWTKISRQLNNRSGKQVRDHYMNVLIPTINKSSWTQQEDEMIMSLYHKYGARWRQIARELQGRTESQVKNRFHMHLKVVYIKRPSAKNQPLKGSKSPLNSIDVCETASTCLESPHSSNSAEVAGKMVDLSDVLSVQE